MASTRPRTSKQSFEIHHDPHYDVNEMPDDEEEEEMEMQEVEGIEELEESEQEQDFDRSEEANNDGYSDSDESDHVVEPAVQEDMDKFQATFKGIKDRFRLINRIGEGM